MTEHYLSIYDFDPNAVHVVHQTHGLKETINMYYGAGMRGISFVTRASRRDALPENQR